MVIMTQPLHFNIINRLENAGYFLCFGPDSANPIDCKVYSHDAAFT